MGGDISFPDLSARFKPNRSDILSTSNLDKAEGYWHLFHGRPEDAVGAFDRACQQPVKHRVLIYHTVAGAPALAKALRLSAQQVEQDDPKRAGHLRRRALRLAKRAAWLSLLFQTERAISLRELSLAYADLGKIRKALKHAERSCTVASGQKARYELAQSTLVASRLREQLGIPGANEQVQAAEATLREFEEPISRM